MSTNAKRKILFLDRDGCLIEEPSSGQIDSLKKLELMPGVISALNRFQKNGYELVMVSNQDGLGTTSYPEETFHLVQNKLLSLFQSQGINFQAIHICPHREEDQCSCRKPKIGLLTSYLKDRSIDWANTYLVGDRDTDRQLAKALGITGYLIGENNWSWPAMAHAILDQPRKASLKRQTRETSISIDLNLDHAQDPNIQTGLPFFDHMLEQFGKHSGMGLSLCAKGDLHIDEHHTVEDVALSLGEAIQKALGDKKGIERYGFLLPMDETRAQVTLDLSARPYFLFEGKFTREKVGDLPTELVPHFFRSLAHALGANLHLQVSGENDHHQIEALFKAVARSLGHAIKISKDPGELPTTKGYLG